MLNVALLGPVVLISPARGTAHALLFVVTLAAFAWIEAANARGHDVSTGVASRGPLLTGLALLAVLLTASLTAAEHVPVVHVGLGTIAIVGGIALRRAAMRALGPAFVSEPRPLLARDRVRHGPYAVFDHPSELGLLAIAAGATLLLGSPPAAIVCATVLTPLVVVRTRAETRALRL